MGYFLYFWETMVKLFYLLIFLFTLPLVGLGQNDSIINDNAFKNQIDVDIYYLGIETSFKRRVINKLFIGTGLRSLMYRPAINFDLETEEEFFELFAIRPFIDFQINKNFHIETGLPFSFTYGDNDTYGSSIAIEVGLFLEVWIFEVGLRPSLLFFKKWDKYETGVLTQSLLILKIPLGRW